MKIILIFFIYILILGQLKAQEKSTAVLAPLGAIGNINVVQKKILFNSLQEELSKFLFFSISKNVRESGN